MAKYREYAHDMKAKFEAYEQESEKYYSDMLEKFKQQTKDVIARKEREL